VEVEVGVGWKLVLRDCGVGGAEVRRCGGGDLGAREGLGEVWGRRSCSEGRGWLCEKEPIAY
jgi:hypothetical protein